MPYFLAFVRPGVPELIILLVFALVIAIGIYVVFKLVRNTSEIAKNTRSSRRDE